LILVYIIEFYGRISLVPEAQTVGGPLLHKPADSFTFA
jgi:hypothetical protein